MAVSSERRTQAGRGESEKRCSKTHQLWITKTPRTKQGQRQCNAANIRDYRCIARKRRGRWLRQLRWKDVPGRLAGRIWQAGGTQCGEWVVGVVVWRPLFPRSCLVVRLGFWWEAAVSGFPLATAATDGNVESQESPSAGARGARVFECLPTRGCGNE